MNARVRLDAAYVPSEDVVARDIDGELLLVPLASGIGDMEDELYTLNQTGRAVWERLDGRRKLRAVVEELSAKYSEPVGKIERDVVGLVGELLKRRILVEVP